MKEIIAPVNKLQKFFAVRETLFKNMSSTQVWYPPYMLSSGKALQMGMESKGLILLVMRI